jgi:hypothetical protein
MVYVYQRNKSPFLKKMTDTYFLLSSVRTDLPSSPFQSSRSLPLLQKNGPNIAFFARAHVCVCRGEFRPRQTRQLPRAVDLKGRFLFLVVVKC